MKSNLPLDGRPAAWSEIPPAPTAVLEHGACAKYDPALWFPVPGAGSRWAKDICSTCPVLGRCRQYAMASPALDGVWGGLTADDRKQLRQNKNRTKP